MDNDVLQALFRATVHHLQAEIPELGDTPVIDTKHIYAWVKENNPVTFTNSIQPVGRRLKGLEDGPASLPYPKVIQKQPVPTAVGSLKQVLNSPE
jgi:hypothetical protein